MFSIGQKVVCILDADDWSPHFITILEDCGMALPEKGKIYTIRGMKPYGDLLALVFEEIQNPELHGISFNGEVARSEPHFDSAGFRPLVEQTTDISIFQKITDKVFKREKVDA